MSSGFVPFPPPEPTEALYLVGFRLDPNVADPQFYSLFVLDSANDRPAVANGRVLFFRRPEMASEALRLSENELQQLGPAPREMELFCDIAEALHLVNSQPTDEEGILLETIVLFDDLVRATQINVPASYMGVMSALSEHLQNSPDLAKFFAESGTDRETVEDAIMWCIGAIAVKATFVG